MKNISLIKKSFLTIGIFSLTTFVTYGAISSSGGVLKSSPYTTRNTTADTQLGTMTNGTGPGILDGVIANVKTKAEQKGGIPLDIEAYNAYLDRYLSLVDQLDTTIKSQYGSDYMPLFQYLYPRVLELKKEESQVSGIVQSLRDLIGQSDTTTTTAGTIDYAGIVRPFVADVVARLGQTDAAYKEIALQAKKVVAEDTTHTVDMEKIIPEIAYALVNRTPTAAEITTVRTYINNTVTGTTSSGTTATGATNSDTSIPAGTTFLRVSPDKTRVNEGDTIRFTYDIGSAYNRCSTQTHIVDGSSHSWGAGNGDNFYSEGRDQRQGVYIVN